MNNCRILASGLAVLAAACSPSPPTERRPAPTPPAVVAGHEAITSIGSAIQAPINASILDATVTASSVLERFDASGLLRATEPGWHSAQHPTYPQWVDIKFKRLQHVSRMSLLPQDGFAVRSPKSIDVEARNSMGRLDTVLTIPNACGGGEYTWRTFEFDQAVDTSEIRLNIKANCGDINQLSLRAVLFE